MNSDSLKKQKRCDNPVQYILIQGGKNSIEDIMGIIDVIWIWPILFYPCPACIGFHNCCFTRLCKKMPLFLENR